MERILAGDHWHSYVHMHACACPYGHAAWAMAPERQLGPPSLVRTPRAPPPHRRAPPALTPAPAATCTSPNTRVRARICRRAYRRAASVHARPPCTRATHRAPRASRALRRLCDARASASTAYRAGPERTRRRTSDPQKCGCGLATRGQCLADGARRLALLMRGCASSQGVEVTPLCGELRRATCMPWHAMHTGGSRDRKCSAWVRRKGKACARRRGSACTRRGASASTLRGATGSACARRGTSACTKAGTSKGARTRRLSSSVPRRERDAHERGSRGGSCT